MNWFGMQGDANSLSGLELERPWMEGDGAEIELSERSETQGQFPDHLVPCDVFCRGKADSCRSPDQVDGSDDDTEQRAGGSKPMELHPL